ncbi:TPA: hypothetical protein ACFO14_000648, partial [Neisseria meningitidis]
AHGNLSCRKGRMLPHTGLFLLGKVALQMRIRRCLKTSGFHTDTNRIHFRTGYAALIYPDKPYPDRKYSGLTKTSTALPRLSSKKTIL